VAGRTLPADNVRLTPGANVRYTVPSTISTDREHTVYLRVQKPMTDCTLKLGDVYAKPLRYVVPAEMVTLKVRPRFLEAFHGGSLSVSVEPRQDASPKGASA
jgi:hypothetical protein